MVDEALVSESEAVAAEARRRRASALAAEEVLGKGPVEKGAWKTIRRATAAGRFSHLEPTADADADAVVIEALTSCAKALDRATGHNLTGWTANGRDIAPLLERLEALHVVLTGKAEADDKFLAWLHDDDAPKEAPAHER